MRLYQDEGSGLILPKYLEDRPKPVLKKLNSPTCYDYYCTRCGLTIKATTKAEGRDAKRSHKRSGCAVYVAHDPEKNRSVQVRRDVIDQARAEEKEAREYLAKVLDPEGYRKAEKEARQKEILDLYLKG